MHQATFGIAFVRIFIKIFFKKSSNNSSKVFIIILCYYVKVYVKDFKICVISKVLKTIYKSF